MVKICGIGESQVAEEIQDLIEKQTNPTIAPYAKTGEVHLRITAKAEDEKDLQKNRSNLIVHELKATVWRQYLCHKRKHHSGRSSRGDAEENKI